MKKKIEDQFKVLRKINKNPKITQREMAKDLGFSLGKLNYCLKALKIKGYIKIDNFNLKTIIIMIEYITLSKKTYFLVFFK